MIRARARRWSIAGVIVVCLLGMTSQADDAQTPTTAPANASHAHADDAPLREQTIYIPYDKLREVFEREGRGVFLPYDEFQRLWQAARDAQVQPPPADPPVGAMVSEVACEATVEHDVVQVAAKVQIDILAEGWHEVPLHLRDAAVTEARIGDAPARLLGNREEGYRLLVEAHGEMPQRIGLDLGFARAFSKSPGRNSVTFNAPRAPVSRWHVRIPETGVKVDIHPMLAATAVPEDKSSADNGETVVKAFVGGAPTVRIDWTPKAEGAQGLGALVSVDVIQRVWIDEGVMRTRADVDYDISRATVESVDLEVSAGQKVVNVYDANVRQWAVSTEGERQVVHVELFDPARGQQRIVVELERFDEGGAQSDWRVPTVWALHVGRQRGTVAVSVAEGLRVDPTERAGLLQVDASEVPSLSGGAGGGEAWALSYRYVTVPFDLVLHVDKVEPRVTVEAHAAVRLRPHAIETDFTAVYDIEKAGVFRVELDMPPGHELLHVQGISAADATPLSIESHHLAGADKTHLVVNLARKAIGRVGLFLKLRKQLDAPALHHPGERPAELVIGLPRPTGTLGERFSGHLYLNVDDSLRANPTEMAGLRSVAVGSAEGLLRETPTADDTRAAYAFAQEPARLSLEVERRKPHVTVRQLLVASVESGVIKVDARFHYEVRYSGVSSLRIDIPADVAPLVQNETAGVREMPIENPDPSPADGYVAWLLRGDRPFEGRQAVHLRWERGIDPLEVGEQVRYDVPVLRPQNVDRAWGQIAIARSEMIDVRPGGGDDGEVPKGLRPIDPQHDLVEPGDALPNVGAAQAFEFHGDWALPIVATRYELEDVKRTSIERALVRAVLTRGDELAVQALYRMRSARQRLPIRLPAGAAFDTEPVRINGRPVVLERAQEGDYFVPLVGRGPDEVMLLEIRYTLADAGKAVVCPEFPDEPAVQKVYVAAYLPPEWDLLGTRGPWTEDLLWRWSDSAGFHAVSRKNAPELYRWVAEQIDVTGDPLESFQTDGRMYLFSTLQPPPAPAGALHLTTVHQHLLSGTVLAVILALGVLLLGAGAGVRLVITGVLLAGLVLMGVFLPMLFMQIVGGVLLSAVFVVAVLWAFHYLVWTRPRHPVVVARREARLAQLEAIAAQRRQTARPAMATESPAPPPKTPDAPPPDAPGGSQGGRGGDADA